MRIPLPPCNSNFSRNLSSLSHTLPCLSHSITALLVGCRAKFYPSATPERLLFKDIIQLKSYWLKLCFSDCFTSYDVSEPITSYQLHLF